MTACWSAFAGLLSAIFMAVLSRRGIALGMLGVCWLLAQGPWLRPPLSRDFRGGHVLWNNTPDALFLPEYAAEVPRATQFASVATPLLVMIGVGTVVVLLRPRWKTGVFGLLLCIGLPAAAATLWNHPGMIEFFEAESRSHKLLRNLFRHESEFMYTGLVQDRTQVIGKFNAQANEETHPLMQPFRYTLYGPWIAAVAMAGVIVSTGGSWRRRLGQTVGWTAAAAVLAVGVTWPRWVAEHHWRLAESYEDANQFVKAEAQLDQALQAMPEFVDTHRHWELRGRLAYRQGRLDEHGRYFEARQRALANDSSTARALLRSLLREMSSNHGPSETEGGVVSYSVDSRVANLANAPVRNLLAETLGKSATRSTLRSDYSVAEIEWREAAELAPWTPIYWIGAYVSQLASDPTLAEEAERSLAPRLIHVGDRMLHSDCLSMIGDAYFQSGDLVRARQMYNKSFEHMNLPKLVNLHAQYGRLGM